MAQITVHQHASHDDVPEPAARGHRDEREVADRERLRSTVPVTIAFGLLLGVVVLAGIALKDLLDFGVWLLSAS